MEHRTMRKREELKLALDNAYATSNAGHEAMQLAWGVWRGRKTQGDAFNDWLAAKCKWDDAYDRCRELQTEYDESPED